MKRTRTGSLPARPMSPGVLVYWAIEGSAQYELYVRQAHKAGRTFPAPGRVRVRAPGVFDSAIGWVEDLGGNAIETHFQIRHDEYKFVAANWHRMPDTGQPHVADDNPDGERERRRVAAEGLLACEARSKNMSLHLAERELDAGLMRLESASTRLLSDMKTAFTKGWFFREEIERVQFPRFDVTKLHYGNRSGINVPDVLQGGFSPHLPRSGPPSPPQLRAMANVDEDADPRTEALS